MAENLITSTPVQRTSLGRSSSTSGPIRRGRRSLIPQTQGTPDKDEVRNDDDAERSSLLASQRAAAASTPHSPQRPHGSMSASPQKEHFQGCLKLYTENKINKDNAWNLQLIDFMTSMLRRHDVRMENLQTASTMIDASARIYSFRVDAVHYDVLKMAGGLSKAAQTKRGKRDDNAATQDEGAAGGDAAAPARRKKKRARAAVAANPEVLNGDFDANDFIDPFFERLAATAGDVTASNRAFNATLPINDKTLELILRTDEPFLRPLEGDGKIELTDKITLPLKLFPPFRETDQICEPFTGFSIKNWDPETEDTEARVTNWMEDNRLNLSQQAVAFDVNAEVEPIPQDEVHDDLYDEEPLGGIESDEEAAAAAACAARAPAPPPRLADMRPAGAADARLEYSYSGAVLAAWAGPSHWRLRNNRASKQYERTQSTAGRLTVDGTSKRPTRTKRQLDFLGAGLAFDSRAEPTGEYESTQPAKIMISRKTLATAHTWNEDNYKTTIDRGLDESHFRKLFLRKSVLLPRQRDLEASKRGEPLAAEPEPLAVEDAQDYDYNNENDASYCVNNVPGGDEWGPEDAAARALHAQPVDAPAGLGELLEPPTKVAKIFIPYAMRAKKVDMKQLKHCTWKLLTETTPSGSKDEVPPTTFSNIYSRLPNHLSSNMRESLSVPLALLSVLHLANEKGLILEKRDDLRDFGILGLIKK